MNVMDLMMLMIVALPAAAGVRYICEKRWSNWR